MAPAPGALAVSPGARAPGALPRALADRAAAGSRSTRAAGGSASAPADAELRARVEVRDPRAYALALRGSTGLGEGYVDGLWTTDDLVAMVRIACRNLAPARSLAPARIHPLVGPLQRALDLRPAQHPRRRGRATSPPTTTSATRLFESFLDRAADLLVRATSPTPGLDPRAGAAGEARADLRAARARPRRPPARDRHRLGRARDPRGREPRLPGDDDDDLARAARLRARAGARGRARRPGRGRCCATTATSRAATTSSSRSR